MGNLKSLNLLCIFLLSITLFTACEFKDTESAVVPAYVCVPSYTFITDTTNTATYQGRNTSDFVDMWLNVSGNSLGNMALPVLIPVVKLGAKTINIDAGIKQSGQEDSRIAYPFIATYSKSVNLVPQQIDTLRPVFSYLPNTHFRFIEDNDYLSSSNNFKLNPVYTLPTDSFVIVSDPGGREPNNKYMKLVMASTSSSFEMYTANEYILPGLGAPVYLELDYKSDAVIQIGYYYAEPPNQISSAATPVIDLYPTDTWKKIYLNLSNEVSARATGSSFRIYIGLHNTNGTAPNVSLDNIKLLSLD